MASMRIDAAQTPKPHATSAQTANKPIEAKPPQMAKSPQTLAALQTPPTGVEQLERLEQEVAAYQVSWIKAGAALAIIHENELYRHVATSFGQYLRERWDIKERHAFKMINAARVVKTVGKEARSLPLCAALELAKLPEGQQAECLRQATAAAGQRGPRVIDIAGMVAKRLPPKPKKKRKAKATRIIKLKSGIIKLKAGADLKTLIAEATAQLAAQSRANAA